ncbi:uncharacterized protein C1orf131 homolog [Malaya genurostris]|uniref:uncharacterized protein C1orf131 homolog n=1 Tax=Malaya genurostris TaxID=325434 RepID=UPI0026F3BC4A|nr:uncharacterized protein C1orf131 homolog [Malaya genurostris]
MCAEFVPVETKASLLLKQKQKDFSVIVHEPRKSKTKVLRPSKITREDEDPSKDNSDQNAEQDIDDIFSDARRRKRKRREDPQLFDISRARKEVINYGISGLDKETKHTAKVALAIKLGAKPPKNVYRNYKEILEERKHKNEESDRSIRRRRGQSFGAAKSFQQQQQRARQKSTNPGSVTKHYGVVKPKIVDKKRKAR